MARKSKTVRGIKIFCKQCKCGCGLEFWVKRGSDVKYYSEFHRPGNITYTPDNPKPGLTAKKRRQIRWWAHDYFGSPPGLVNPNDAKKEDEELDS